MAGVDNLRPPQSTAEARERGRKGGIASGKSKRRKKAMRAALSAMLASKVPPENAGKFGALGVDPEDADWQTVILAALIKKAAGGNVNAIEQIASLTLDDPVARARADEVRLRREELKERKREFDAEMERRNAQDGSGGDDVLEAWIRAIAEGDADGDGGGADGRSRAAVQE